MASIGEMLRKAREAQGRSVEDLAAELCITQRYLRAIEGNDIKALPGTFFFLSFARQYAAIVGLDRDQAATMLKGIAELADKPAETSAGPHADAPRSVTFPSSPVRSVDPIVEDTNRRYFAGYPVGISVAGLLAAVLLGSGIFAWWTRPPQTARVTPPPPVKISRTIPLPKPAAEAPAAAPVVSNASFEPAANLDDAHQVTLNLSATERTWLSITSQGKVIFSGILEPSQSKTLKGSDVATMKVGNAGGVDIQWNGKSIGPIGPRGQVRTVRFTREHFHILSAADESPGQL